MKSLTHIVISGLLFAGTLCAQDRSFTESNRGTVVFRENKGQVSDQYYQPRPDILFSGSSGALNFHLKSTGISYQLSRVEALEKESFRITRPGEPEHRSASQISLYRLDIHWLNANPQATVVKGVAQAGYDNFYLSACPGGALRVSSYRELSYKSIYPGIDLRWYEHQGSLKYEYLVGANANYKTIQLSYEGAEKIYVDQHGELIVQTPLGTLTEQKPYVTQNGKALAASWQVKGNTVSFDIQEFDPALPLVIDPLVRLWATYYGGLGEDNAFYTYVDQAGDVFMSGGTKSTANIATTGAHQTSFGGSGVNDAYVVKFNSAGVRQWATYYGGSGDDFGAESITDANGNVYFTGGTRSPNGSGVIATAGAHQMFYSIASTNNGDAFLVALNSSGIRLWGTYYGGAHLDAAYGISLDNANNIYIAGTSASTMNISTQNSQQPLNAGGNDGFLAKFSNAGVLLWGTYFGGSSQFDYLFDCATNAAGETYISGSTASSGLATTGSHQSTYGGAGNADGCYAKYNAAGVLQWATYFGGTGNDGGNSIALDASGNLYGVGYAGNSSAGVIASAGSHQSATGGGTDAYLVKFDPTGMRLWSTYYGGTGNEWGFGMTVDAIGNILFCGNTITSGASATKIATPCTYQTMHAGGNTDGFLVMFRANGQRIWGTYYGSIYSDSGTHCAADANGNIYLCGATLANSNTVIASSNGHQPAFGGGSGDAYLVKFGACTTNTPPDLTPPASLLSCHGGNVTLLTTCGSWFSSLTGTTAVGAGSSFTTGPLSGDTTFYLEDVSCGVGGGTRTAVNVTVSSASSLSITNSAPNRCVGEYITLTASGATSYTWSTNPITYSSSISFYMLLGDTYTITSINANGCRDTLVYDIQPELCQGIEEAALGRNQVQVYPNPAAGQFHVQGSAQADLLLTNELGQTLRTIPLRSSNHFTAVIQDLPEGVYFLTSGTTGTFHKKIIVLH